MQSVPSLKRLFKWLEGITYFLFVSAIGILGWWAYLSFNATESSLPAVTKTERPQWPKNPFAMPEEFTQNIGGGTLALKWNPPQIELPDLREEIVYFGKNERPDLSYGEECYLIGFKESKETQSIKKGEKIYLAPKTFGGNQRDSGRSSRFRFSSYPTSLWLEISAASDREVSMDVRLQDENGKKILNPEEHSHFVLERKEEILSGIHGWELGGYRVDGTLLVRQRARWMGKDQFLHRFGGESYAAAKDKQRIDFLDDENPYACFADVNDFMVWDQTAWRNPFVDEDTSKYPLLIVKRIEDKVMHLEIWNQEGNLKIPLTLIRSKDYEPLPEIEQEFRFMGAKTWSQFIVECRGQRQILRPHDWLVLTQDGWKRISSVEEVDDYVEQRIQGPLFVLDSFAKENGRQLLRGYLYNASRTEEKIVELPAQNVIGNAASLYSAANGLSNDGLYENVRREEK